MSSFEDLVNYGEKLDKKIIDFVKALEEAGIFANGSHKNEQFRGAIYSIISMSKKDFTDYIKANPENEKVKLIYNEYNDWIQSYVG